VVSHVRTPEETVLPSPRDETQQDADVWQPSIDRARYDDAVARIREHIAAGDTYQVNHTLRLRSTVRGDERGLYRDLSFAQRGAHAAYLNVGRYRVLSASPELFFRIDGDRLTTRPMKGTAPRGRWSAEDDEIRRH
jgi:para-aminobenzoate synthetase/4-amino-4-deoxychorismate lyase